MRRALAVGISGLLFAALGACGDDSNGAGPAEPEGDTSFGTADGAGDVSGPEGDSGTAGDAEPAGDAADGAEPADAAGDPEDAPAPEPELVPDETPPSVVATTPADGESNVGVPFVVSITWSEPVAKNTISTAKNGTVKMTDVNGGEVPLTHTVSEDGTVVTVTPNTDVFLRASPYKVWLSGNIISDLTGKNKMMEPFTFTFFTENYEDMDGYHELAGKYAPAIHADTTETGGKPQTRVPTKFDADGDWDGSNNVAYVKSEATKLIPAVYYQVTESWTHYFVHYLYLFPYLRHPTADLEHGNGALGAMVVVEKAKGEAPERPVAVTLYWKRKTNEENVTYVTEESGIVGPKGASFYGDVEAALPEATLFPGGRFESWISPDYESCAWAHEKTGIGADCELTAAKKALMTKLVFAYGGNTPTPVEKGEGGFPTDMSELEGAPASLSYVLVPIVSSLWPRRTLVGDDLVYGDDFSYSNPGRPGDGSLLPSSFVDAVDPTDSQLGRPVWAWRHNPATGGEFGIGPGLLGVDPAWYLCTRHGSIDGDTAIPKCAAVTGASAFSVTYCFNAFANVDARGTDPSCP